MGLTPRDVDFVAELLEREAGIALPASKEYLVRTRLLPVARNAGYRSVGSLLADLRGDLRAGQMRHLRDNIVEALTINETWWFRDEESFAALARVVLPTVIAGTPGGPVRIWSAACSTGQEPYSIALQLERSLPPGHAYHIVASDLSTEMVCYARAGRYTEYEVGRGLGARDLAEHFERVEDGWTVAGGLRRNVTFRQINLAKQLPMLPPFDVVFLRNVLIYFRPETRRDLLCRMQRLLRPGGWLMLGATEAADVNIGYQRVPVGRTVIYRVPAQQRRPRTEVTTC